MLFYFIIPSKSFLPVIAISICAWVVCALLCQLLLWHLIMFMLSFVVGLHVYGNLPYLHAQFKHCYEADAARVYYRGTRFRYSTF